MVGFIKVSILLNILLILRRKIGIAISEVYIRAVIIKVSIILV
jgi:hypothetical protein